MADTTHIKNLYALLGAKTILLPIPRGSKAPVREAWEATRWTDTQTDEYQAHLQRGNVGVLLGAASDGLCAIDIDDDRDMEPFFNLNPGLRDTLITRGARGCQIWVRCIQDDKSCQLQIDRHPKTYALKFKAGVRDRVDKKGMEVPGQFGEWRADGGQSVVWGTHPSGSEYHFVNESAVIEINFRDIAWPSSLAELPWGNIVGDALIRTYGEPWVTDDKGNPKLMIEPFWAGLFAYRHDVLYEKEEERFYIYDSARGLWEKSSDQDVSYLGTQMLLDVSREKSLPILQGPRFRAAAKMSAINNHLKGMVGKRDIFKNRRGLIHVKNGMIDLTESTDGSIRVMPFAPHYYSRNQIPVSFDPEADCPNFLERLLGAGLTDDNVSLMQRWSGLMLLQDNIYQKIMILTGTPGGGKSTVMAVFQKIVGQDNCAQLRTEQLLERFEMAGFIGKTTLIGADVPGNFLMQRGAYKLKQLTGGDFFQAEIKTARDLVTLYGNFNVGITCNSRLRISMDSDSGAWDRRLVIIKYDAPKPKKAIPNFADWLVSTEGPGILNWMIEGALEILSSKQFKMTGKQRRAVTDLLEESDSMRSFLRACVQPSGREHDVTTEELAEAYHNFCNARSWDALPSGSFERKLPDLMLEMFRANKNNNIKRDNTKRRGFSRLKLVDPDYESNVYESAEEAYSQ